MKSQEMFKYIYTHTLFELYTTVIHHILGGLNVKTTKKMEQICNIFLTNHNFSPPYLCTGNFSTILFLILCPFKSHVQYMLSSNFSTPQHIVINPYISQLGVWEATHQF